MKYIPLFIFILLPTMAGAAAGDDVFTVQKMILDLLGSLSTLFWLAIIAFFILGVVKFIRNAEDSKEREKGRQFIIWAIIALVVLVSLWGLVRFFGDTLGINFLGGSLDKVNKDGIIIP